MKLTAPQERVLRRVVNTNGGGIYVEVDPDRRVIMRLHEMGLVQGKASHAARVVHTRDGLDLIRHIDAIASAKPTP